MKSPENNYYYQGIEFKQIRYFNENKDNEYYGLYLDDDLIVKLRPEQFVDAVNNKTITTSPPADQTKQEPSAKDDQDDDSSKVVPLKQKAQQISNKFKLRQNAKNTEGYEALKSSWDNNYAGAGHDFDIDFIPK